MTPGTREAGLELRPGRAGAPTVLVVEDDADVREALVDFLGDAGYEVAFAENGGEALEYLARADPPPRLILLDLMMPGMDAFEFRARQRDDARIAGVPVVIVSADRLALEKSQELAAAGCLTKPIRPDQLLEVVGRYA